MAQHHISAKLLSLLLIGVCSSAHAGFEITSHSQVQPASGAEQAPPPPPADMLVFPDPNMPVLAPEITVPQRMVVAPQPPKSPSAPDPIVRSTIDVFHELQRSSGQLQKLPDPYPVQEIEEAPVQVTPESVDILRGFGKDLPLPVALEQVLPQGYTYSFSSAVNAGQTVSWSGGDPWQDVLGRMLDQRNYVASIDGNSVFIFEEKASASVMKAPKVAEPVAPVPVVVTPPASIPVEIVEVAPPYAPPPPSSFKRPQLEKSEFSAGRILGQNQGGYIVSRADPIPVMSYEPQPTPASMRSEVEKSMEPMRSQESPVTEMIEIVPAMPEKMDAVSAPEVVPVEAEIDVVMAEPIDLQPEIIMVSPVEPVPPMDRKLPDNFIKNPDGTLSPAAPIPVMPMPANIIPLKTAFDPLEGINVERTWRAVRGDTLREILLDWSKDAGVELQWMTDYDYPVDSSLRYEGNFKEAVENILTGLRAAQPRPVARLHPNAPSGPAVLVVNSQQVVN